MPIYATFEMAARPVPPQLTFRREIARYLQCYRPSLRACGGRGNPDNHNVHA